MECRFDTLPNRLKDVSVQQEIAGVPCLLVRHEDTKHATRPFLFWMHGRTADKELDPGRYLRCVRRGINVCAVDLPFHGQRYDERSRSKSNCFAIIQQMVEEIDEVLEGLNEVGGFDLEQVAIGGMSAGGLIAISRMMRPHPFKAAVLEATGGSWSHLRQTAILSALSDSEFDGVNPMNHLDSWRDIPVLAFHSRHDSWIPFETESEFIQAIKELSSNPNEIELVSFDRTGAPDEHMGFGRESAFVKEVQVDFLARHLL